MNNIESRWATVALKYRAIIIVTSIIVVALLGAGSSRLAFDTSYRAYFSDDNPELLAFEAMENTYTKDDNVLVVLAPHDKNVFTANNLAAVEKFTELAWQTPHSNRVDSISNFQFTEAYEDDLIVRDMVKNAESLDDVAIAEVRKNVLAEPILANRLISTRGHVTGINITVQLAPDERADATGEIMAFIRETIATFKQDYPRIDVHVSGMVPLDQAFYETSLYDSVVLFPIALGLMILSLAYFVGGFFGTLGTVVVIAMSNIAAIGAGGYLGHPLTGTSGAIPIIILTVAVANAVHLLVTFAHGIHQGLDKYAAMAESLRVNLQPIALASVTTAIGFLTMNFSDVPPFAHMGTQVAIGVITSFILTVSFLPALMTLAPIRADKREIDDTHVMARLAGFVIDKRRLLLIGLSVSFIGAIANLPRNEINDIFMYYFDPSLEFRADSDFMVENLTGIDQINFSINARESGGISDPAFLADIEKFERWLSAQPQACHTNSFVSVMKRLNKNMHADDASYYQLPSDRELAAQYLLLYEMSLPYGLDLNNQINVDKSQTKVTVTTEILSSQAMIDFNEKALNWARANLTEIDGIKSAGTGLMFSYIGQRNNFSMIIGTFVALVMIAGVIMIALRSVRIGLVSLLPNLVPAAVAFGLWGIFVGEVGLSLSVVAGMTFGIVVDDSVHFLSKYIRARRENAMNAIAAVRYAFTTVGRALAITTVVLILGFSVVATSKMAMNGDMGLMTTIIIALALATVFLMLPPLLIAVDGKDEAST